MLDVIPSFHIENSFFKQGYTLIAGIDEAGRAPVAGPVAAGAVILRLKSRAKWLDQVRDSKIISSEKREELARKIECYAVSYGVGFVSNGDIDRFGISKATRIAMRKAVECLYPPPEALIIDYFALPELNIPQRGILHGDSLCYSIACASILAKVARDQLMNEMDDMYPGYGFRSNKGYPTSDHLDSINRLGPCPIHRMTFKPLKPRLDLPLE